MKYIYMFIQGDPKFFLGTPRRLPSEGPGDGFTEGLMNAVLIRDGDEVCRPLPFQLIVP